MDDHGSELRDNGASIPPDEFGAYFEALERTRPQVHAALIRVERDEATDEDHALVRGIVYDDVPEISVSTFNIDEIARPDAVAALLGITTTHRTSHEK